jgi:uncharacterized RmlC-like cupin family protein
MPTIILTPFDQYIRSSAVASCVVVRHREAETYVGRQGENHLLGRGISRESAGSERLCQHWLVLRAGLLGHVHVHAGHETCVTVISGQVDAWWGGDLEHHLRLHPRDHLWIPAGMPHLAYSAGGCEVVLSRSDPAEQESVELRPELDGLGLELVAALRQGGSSG